jgi:CelD/BcsL family acetyltransferase involved in cellulose biosynthesis
MTVATALEVHVGCTEECFSMPEWHALLASDPDKHIFATPEWHRTWWEEFGSGLELLILTMSRAGTTTAIVPLYKVAEGDRQVLRFIGGIDLTDYLGPICPRDAREDVARALTAWLDETDSEWHELDAHNLPVPFGFSEMLVDWADRRNFSFELDQEETAALIPLTGDWDSYLDSLAKKDRHELKRKRRRLWRETPQARVRASNEETLERDLQTFIDMHRGTEGHKGHFMRPEIATFFVRVAKTFFPLGRLQLHLLETPEEALAATFSFEYASRFYLYNSAYEPGAASLAPGLVLVSELLKDCMERGVQVFDFLRGPERYKYQLGAQAVPLNNVRVIK